MAEVIKTLCRRGRGLGGWRIQDTLARRAVDIEEDSGMRGRVRRRTVENSVMGGMVKVKERQTARWREGGRKGRRA